MKHRIYRFLFAALILALLLAGCYDRRELNTLGFVMGVAIDKGENKDEIELSLQMAKVTGSDQSEPGSGSKESGTGGDSYINVSASGESINQIVRDMEYKVSRRIYVPHNQVVVFGEDMARQGIRDGMDFFARAPEARATVYVLVAKGKAADILEADTVFEKMPSSDLKKIIDEQDITSTVPQTTLYDIMNDILSRSKAPILPYIEILDDKGSKRINCLGSAVFKNDKMIGHMDLQQTRGTLYVLDKVQTGTMTVKFKDAAAAAEIRQSKSKVKLSLKKDGGVKAEIQVRQTVGIGDQKGTLNIANAENIPVLLKESEKTVKEEIMAAIDKAKELGADVFGFGKSIYRKYPRKWKEIEENWEEVFREMETVVKVKSKADGSGRIMRPIAPAVQ
jgi:Ger(x)C family germination protein